MKKLPLMFAAFCLAGAIGPVVAWGQESNPKIGPEQELHAQPMYIIRNQNLSGFATTEDRMVLPREELQPMHIETQQEGGFQRLLHDAQREIKNVTKFVVPANLTCAQYTANPIYAQTMVLIHHNKGELAHYGVVDSDSCRTKRDILVAIAAKANIALAGVTWDIGRCACEASY